MKLWLKPLLNKLTNNLVQQNLDVKSIILFGSHARGDSRLSSDIDIAIVSNNSLSHESRGLIRCILDELHETVEINPFFTKQEYIEKANDYFDTNFYIKNEGIILWQE